MQLVLFVELVHYLISALSDDPGRTDDDPSLHNKHHKTMPSLDYEMFTTTGKREWMGSWHKHISDDSLTPVDEVLEERLIDETRLFISTSVPEGITKRWTLKLRGQLKPRERDCTFEFGLTAAGRAKVSLCSYLKHTS